MAKLLYFGTRGTDDPTQATFPFFLAKGAVEAGHEPAVTLLGESAPLIRGHIAEQIQGVGLPPLKELMDFLIEHKVPILV